MINVYTMKQVIEWTDDTEPGVVEGLLYPGQLSLLIGAPKMGKTTLARSLCLAVARGVLWAGRQCAKCDVLMVQAEGARLHERDAFRRLGATGEDRIYLSVEPTDPDRETFLNDLTEVIQHYKPGLVVIDTLFRALHIEDSNDYSVALRAMEAIAKVARENSVHVMLLHHARKGGGTHNNMSLGSQALTGTTDCNLVLGGPSGAPMLASEQRYGNPIQPPVRVYMDQETGWVSTDSTESRADRVIAVLDQHPGRWVTYARLATQTGMSRDVLVTTIKPLLDSGRIERRGRGKPGDPKKLRLT